jgi:hypothetical protein
MNGTDRLKTFYVISYKSIEMTIKLNFESKKGDKKRQFPK